MSDCKTELRRLKKSYNIIFDIDFFPLPEQAKTEAYLDEMETIFHEPVENGEIQAAKRGKMSGCIRVTKRNVYVDRMASAIFDGLLINYTNKTFTKEI